MVRERTPSSSRPVGGTPAARPRRHWLAWQGWRLTVPSDWNVVQIDGGWSKGFVLLADLERPRMGLRWETLPDGRDPAAAVEAAMAAEVGSSAGAVEAAAEGETGPWTAARLFLDPDTPGRDLWIAHGRASGRIVQLSCPTGNGRRRLKPDLVPVLADSDPDGPRAWSVLDLSCFTPAGWTLERQQLSAGDLRLTFTADAGRRLLVRQVAPARLALSRQPIERWLAQHPVDRRRGDSTGEVDRSYAAEVAGRQIDGLRQAWTRRAPWPARIFRRQVETIDVCALHDADRDRLWIVESNAPDALAGVVESLGWAADPDAALDALEGSR